MLPIDPRRLQTQASLDRVVPLRINRVTLGFCAIAPLVLAAIGYGLCAMFAAPFWVAIKQLTGGTRSAVATVERVTRGIRRPTIVHTITATWGDGAERHTGSFTSTSKPAVGARLSVDVVPHSGLATDDSRWQSVLLIVGVAVLALLLALALIGVIAGFVRLRPASTAPSGPAADAVLPRNGDQGHRDVSCSRSPADVENDVAGRRPAARPGSCAGAAGGGSSVFCVAATTRIGAAHHVRPGRLARP